MIIKNKVFTYQKQNRKKNHKLMTPKYNGEKKQIKMIKRIIHGLMHFQSANPIEFLLLEKTLYYLNRGPL